MPQTILPRPRHELYPLALRNVYDNRGTWYDIPQESIDRVTYPRGQPTAPWRTLRSLEAELNEHNRLDRALSSGESRAHGRLNDAILWCQNNKWGPDLVIKAFLDLDRLFFCSRLRDFVKVIWKPSFNSPGRTIAGFVKTDDAHPDSGRFEIWMNAREIIQSGSHPPFHQMFITLLHEMT